MPETGGPHFLLRVRCPGCGSALQFHSSAAGQSRHCPKCKTAFRVTAGRRKSPAAPRDPGAADDGPEAAE